jgi:molybdate transport system substrate-binding protein
VAHVFGSADTGHPKRLAEQGFSSGPVEIFARNELCALARAGLTVTADTLLDVMLATKIRLGNSTTKADPSGDDAFAVFAMADALKAGAKIILEAKAVQMAGGPASPKAPEGRTFDGWLMATDQADVFLTYCTNAVQAKAEVPTCQVIGVPKPLSVGADNGVEALKGAPAVSSQLI